MMKIILASLTILLITSCNLINKQENLPLLSPKNVTIVPSTTVDYSAHWLQTDTIVINTVKPAHSYYIAKLNSNTAIPEFEQILPLNRSDIDDHLIAQNPHLSSFTSFTLAPNKVDIKTWLKGKLAVVEVKQNIVTHIAYLQHAKLLDQLYASNIDKQKLGAVFSSKNITLTLWAPTALNVEVLLTKQSNNKQLPKIVQLKEDKTTGLWSTALPVNYQNYYYQYKIRQYHPALKTITNVVTTDPYSLSLSTNSLYSQIVDLTNSSTQPNGWLQQRDNGIASPEDNIFYETHIRDFSFADKRLSNENHRGKYGAFLEKNSDGIHHLKQLADAGINSIHLLPTFDMGTINENDNQTIDLTSSIAKLCSLQPSVTICQQPLNQTLTLADILKSYDPLSSNAQLLISEIKTIDRYNWGYDPFHYTVPEGSYAENPQGVARIIEFRAMIQALHNMGFRVIMDVVYNHTHQAGMKPTSVLDKIVPNYYQRLNPISGNVEQSTCCDNTATENIMMKKLMIDSLVVWARDYKIDGFRFDLMAHQPKKAMIAARNAVRKVDPDTYFYGEGWNFGEVANNQRFVQASQLELAGTEIGTFTDRLRDAVRGGAFSASGNEIRQSQGIGNGLATLPNELTDKTKDTVKYLLFADQLRVGLAGNLINFPLINAQGQQVLGKDIPYGDQPTGYALDPADTINYISKHDNQTLWDNNQYRLPFNTSTADRVRLQIQSLSFALYAQGIPFIHMGSELLRSKSYLRDSYDYNDWFNIVDFSMTSNNYHVGLPPAEKDQANWPLITRIIKNNHGRDMVSSKDIAFSKHAFLDMIKVRMSSPLFRLTNEKQIIERVKFHNTGPNQTIGLIAMSISDQVKDYMLDANIDQIMVIFNTTPTRQKFPFNNSDQYQLHPILQNGSDNVVKTAQANNGYFSVPPLTTAVFVKERKK